MNAILVASWIEPAQLVEHLWRASWQGGAALAIAWIVTRAWRSLSPRMACWVWRLAYAKLFIALLWATPLDIPLLKSGSLELVVIPRVSQAQNYSPPALDRPLHTTNDSPIGDVSIASNDAAPSLARLSWKGALVVAWALGVVATLGISFRQWRAAERQRASSAFVTSECVLTVFREEARRLCIRRRVELRCSLNIQGPLLTGIRRPTILLPAADEAMLGAEELRLMLAHELAHVLRGDLAWNGVPALARAIFFFHPFIWLAERGWLLAEESACDALLIERRIARPADYARLLLKLATRPRDARRPAYAAVGVLGQLHNLEWRIEAMARVRSVSSVQLAVMGIALSLIALVGIAPWRLVAQESRPPQKSANPAAGSHGDTKGASTSVENQWRLEKKIMVANPTPILGGKDIYKVWLDGGWLKVERRSSDDGVEWRMALAREIHDETPRITAPENSGHFEVSYAQGRYFVREDLGDLRAVLEPVTGFESFADNNGLPPRDQSRGSSSAGDAQNLPLLEGWMGDHSFYVTGGEDNRPRFDLRLCSNKAPREHGSSASGAHLRRVHCGEFDVAFDGDLLVARRENTPRILISDQRPGVKSKVEQVNPAQLRGAPQELTHDDGVSAGKKSLAGGAHAVRFHVDGNDKYLNKVMIYGSRYGYPQAPNRKFWVCICDDKNRLLARFEFPYSTFPREKVDWVTLDLKPTKVPQDFIVCVDFNPRQTQGVYVHYDAAVSGDSLTGEPGSKPIKFAQGDWLIRAVVDELKPPVPAPSSR